MILQALRPRIRIQLPMAKECSSTTIIKGFAVEKTILNEPLGKAWHTYSGYQVVKYVVSRGDRKALIQLCEMGYAPDSSSEFLLLISYPQATAVLIEYSSEIADALSFQISHHEPKHYPMIEAIMRRQMTKSTGVALLREFAFWKMGKFPWAKIRL